MIDWGTVRENDVLTLKGLDYRVRPFGTRWLLVQTRASWRAQIDAARAAGQTTRNIAYLYYRYRMPHKDILVTGHFREGAS